MRTNASVKIWEETVVIPTYRAGEPEKSPLFIEKRAYQGSTGKVYPLPVTETVSDEKTDVEYHAVFLENEYLKVMVLPELGGRIHRAYDKTNGYDFVYYNHVIRPALVGLAGPWISGGIEFNWPQHHRPSTFSPVDHMIEEKEDGSCTVYLSETDKMYGTKGMAEISLYPGKAYIEIRGQLYNGTDLPQTFLWWANPAVPVNDHTFSVFPPDVYAVMDHGKRAVSTFPIATGEYYKWDYSAGVDISHYKNVKVPTSYMAAHSDFDFIGNYDESREAGLLHVADHHISPGKKQWTWGCGDFGRMWDWNLTETDGPYIELMTGVFTDNQPDFSWLKPQEEKTFVQYFMPYKGVGRVGNATKDAVVSLTWEGERTLCWKIYATGEYPGAEVVIYKAESAANKGDALQSAPADAAEVLCRKVVDLSPETCVTGYVEMPSHREPPLPFLPTPDDCSGQVVPAAKRGTDEGNNARQAGETYDGACQAGEACDGACQDSEAGDGVSLGVDACDAADYRIEVRWKNRLLAAYTPYKKKLEPIPQPAEPLKKPAELKSLEELYLAATHLEQYRHATREPADYYQEGLRRDPTDIRLNNGYGLLLLKRGKIRESIPYFQRAVKKQTWKNPNPYSGECYFNLGLAYALSGQEKKAYDAFFKSTWSAETQSAGFYWLGCLASRESRYEEAVDFAEKSMLRSWHNMNARMLRAAMLRKLGSSSEAFLKESLQIDPLHMGCLYEMALLENDGETGLASSKAEWKKKMRREAHNYLEVSLLYIKAGLYEEALDILQSSPEQNPLCLYYQGFVFGRMGDEERARELCMRAEEANPDCCFPNRIEEIEILEYCASRWAAPMSHYYLGNLYYDRKQYTDAIRHWEIAAGQKDSFAMVHRNLSIAYYNRQKDTEKAMRSMRHACELDETYPRMWLEYDQLAAKANLSIQERLETMESHQSILRKRDDLYLRNIMLKNCAGRYQEALDAILSHQFHPWEGGEGKVSTQYRYALIHLALAHLKEGRPEKALADLEASLTYPTILGEGKLPNVPDNQAHYYMGMAYRMMGNTEKAEVYLELAAGGPQEPEPVLYYNDQPSDYIFYQGLANRALGKEATAKKAFHRLIAYGEAHLFDQVEYDFFAVSLPEIEIYQEDLEKRNRLYCNYLRALGSIGLYELEKAARLLKEILSEQADYQGALEHLELVI